MEGTARDWLQRLHALPRRTRFRIMNVCGGHERVITHAGLRGALPDYIELIPGPGCPVCICPEEDIYAAMHMALHHPVILLCFGDLLRVPVNAPRDTPRSLLEARAAGADVRAIASPLEARAIARRHPGKPVVFFAAGFEPTMAPVAAMIAEDMPDNLLLLIAGRLTWPAVAMLLASGAPGFDALIAPGHVATVMGSEEWRFVSAQYDLPTAIAGFGAESLLAAVYAALQQDIAGTPQLDNCYPALVTAAGNAAAQRLLRKMFEIVDGNWRGIGVIPHSAFALRGRYCRLDAHTHFPVDEVTRRRAGEMPPGCACAEVVLGRIYPDACSLYGKGCTTRPPRRPSRSCKTYATRRSWTSPTSASARARRRMTPTSMCLPISRPARTASPNCATARIGATVIPSSTARAAGRAIP